MRMPEIGAHGAMESESVYEVLSLAQHWPIKVINHEVFDDVQETAERAPMFEKSGFISHWHPDVEIFYNIGPGCTVRCDSVERSLSSNDIALINSNDIHSFDNIHGTGHHGVTLLIAYRFLQEVIPQIDDIRFVIDSSEPYCAELCTLLLEFKQTIAQDDPWMDFTLRSTLYRLLHVLASQCMVQKNAVLNPRTAKYRELYSQIISYIAKHYAEHIGPGQIAKQFGYSAEHFSRSFKRYTGVSPLRHIKRVRASASRELLRDTDMRVSDIALAAGEPDARTFIGDFKREYGMTPARYRSIYRS